MQSLPPLYTLNRKLDIRHTPLLTQAGYFPHPTPLQLRLLGLTHTAFKVKQDTLMNRKWPYTPSDYIPTYGVVQKPPFWSHHRLPLSRAWLNSLLKFYATNWNHIIVSIHQYGSRFSVLAFQYGGRDVMRKGSINETVNYRYLAQTKFS